MRLSPAAVLVASLHCRYLPEGPHGTAMQDDPSFLPAQWPGVSLRSICHATKQRNQIGLLLAGQELQRIND